MAGGRHQVMVIVVTTRTTITTAFVVVIDSFYFSNLAVTVEWRASLRFLLFTGMDAVLSKFIASNNWVIIE
jgi:hypothetical protein